MKQHVIKVAFLFAAGLGTVLAAQQTPGANPPSAPMQPQAHRTMDPQKQLDRLSKRLTLSADQQNQILPILTDRQQQIAAIENDTSLDQKQRHAKMKAVREDSESKLRSVLNDNQRAAYDQMRQQAREHSQEHKQSSVQ